MGPHNLAKPVTIHKTHNNLLNLVHLFLQVLREGMGQAADITNKDALDTVITNALIVDAVAGIFKADVGIKVCPTSENI